MRPAAPRGSRRYIYRSFWMRSAAGLADALGWVLVWLTTLGRGWRVSRASPERILVIRLDHIGDVLFSRPSLYVLRKLYPQARITMLASSAAANLLKSETAVDEWLVWDAPWFDRSGMRRTQPSFMQLAGLLKAKQFDLGLELRGDLRHILLLWLAGVRVRVGYGITGGGFLLHHCLTLAPGRHEVERDLDVVESLGPVQRPLRYPRLALTPEELAWAERFWNGQGRRIVIHPGAGDPAKCWPADRFAEVCRRLAPGNQVAVVGSQAEHALAGQVAAAGSPEARNAAGACDLRRLAALISAADLFIGNDSGPVHLSLTQAVPSVLLWSETNASEEWGPWGRVQARVIRHPLRPEAVAEVEVAARAFLARAKDTP